MKFWYLSTKSGTEEKDLLMEKTARELGIQLTEQHIGDGVTDSSSSEMRELIRRMEMSRVDAVICRGRMERLLKEAGADRKIPVIPVQHHFPAGPCKKESSGGIFCPGGFRRHF